MSEKLKPCPVCGSRAELHYDCETERFKVVCPTEGCFVGAAYSQKESGAINRWNTRPPTDEGGEEGCDDVEVFDKDEALKLCRVVDWFAGKMKRKLIKKLNQGFHGWEADTDVVIGRLEKCIDKFMDEDSGQAVDIANLVMFILYQEVDGKPEFATPTPPAPSVPVADALKAIDDEPECPGAMPDEMWDAIRDDRNAAEKAIRIAVTQTKQGIKDRLIARHKGGE